MGGPGTIAPTYISQSAEFPVGLPRGSLLSVQKNTDVLLDQYEINNASENLGMVLCESCKDFSIKCDVLFLESVDEAAIRRKALRTESGINANTPETAKLTLLCFSVAESVRSGFKDCITSGAFFF